MTVVGWGERTSLESGASTIRISRRGLGRVRGRRVRLLRCCRPVIMTMAAAAAAAAAAARLRRKVAACAWRCPATAHCSQPRGTTGWRGYGGAAAAAAAGGVVYSSLHPVTV